MLIKESGSDKVLLIIVNILLFIALITILFPLLFILSASFSDPVAVISGKVWLWPVGFNILGYKAVFKNIRIISGFKNSVIYTFFGTIVNIMLTTMMAFPLSRKDFNGRKTVMSLLIVTMFFSGGLIPTYLLVDKLNMINTVWAMIILGAVSAWNVFLTKNFMQHNIPDTLFEAAAIDGSDEIRFFFQFAIPLSMPIIAVLILYCSVGHWNSYFNALIYIYDQKRHPLQVVLREILIMSNIDATMFEDVELANSLRNTGELLKYAVIIVASVPVLCLYPFIQRYFVKGIMVGALKG